MALGVPENGTLRFLLQVEQVHLRADLAMIALRRFLKPRQMRLKLFLVEPARAVNAGQHRILLIATPIRSEEHTSELQSLMRTSYAVFCLKKKKKDKQYHTEDELKYKIT